MPLIVNLRHLENRNLVLRGDLPLAELDFDVRDEMIRARRPLHYDLEVEMLDDSLARPGIAPTDAGMPVRPLPKAV